jgi:single-stranded-DNA-specific exonuclease
MTNLNKEIIEFVDANWKYSLPNVQNSYVKIFDYLGLSTKKAIGDFLKPSLRLFNHPFLMKDMELAVDILIDYLDKGKRILFYGDYDADGATTTALFVSVLKEKGYENIDWFVPHRHEDGYGLSLSKLLVMQKDYDLLITGDTGIKEMETISKLSIPVIVTDHHEPVVSKNPSDIAKHSFFGKTIKKDGEIMIIPRCLAVVNPKRIDCEYPNEWLSGVAVIYKLLQGLFIKKGWNQMELIPHLDFVALGLVADLVPQIDKKTQDLEIRAMTAFGLKMMNEQPKAWVSSLLEVSKGSSVTFSDLGFRFGPRINAPGRLDSANPAVEFLLTTDPELSLEYAKELESINNERKTLQQSASDSALEQMIALPEYYYKRLVVVKLEPMFHSGIAGLVASRLVEKYKVPAIVLCEKEIDGVPHLSGSCRSVEGISILDILIGIDKKIGILRFGGHDGAAGLTILKDDFESFQETGISISNNLPDDLYKHHLNYDIKMQFEDVDFGVAQLMENSFHQIRFISENNPLYSPATSFGKNHGSFPIKAGNKHIKPVAFFKGSDILQSYLKGKFDTVDLVYKLTIYNNDSSFTVDDWKFKTIY